MVVEVSPDYIFKTGDVAKQFIRGVNNGELPASDEDVVNSLMSVSNEEIEDEIYRQTGAMIKIKNRNVEVLNPGWEYMHVVEFEVVEAKSPTAIAIAVAIVAVSLTVLLIALDWFLEKTLLIETPAGEIDLRGIFLILVIVAFIMWLLKK